MNKLVQLHEQDCTINRSIIKKCSFKYLFLTVKQTFYFLCIKKNINKHYILSLHVGKYKKFYQNYVTSVKIYIVKVKKIFTL